MAEIKDTTINELYESSSKFVEMSDLIEPPVDWANVEGLEAPENKATRRSIFAQNSAPTELYKSGDLWFDTDDDNHCYRSNDNMVWVSVRDGAIFGKVEIYYQATAPVSGMATNDYWIDSDDNSMYRYNGSAWVSVQDAGIQSALSDAADAQATADGKIVSWFQTTAPTATSIGDIWFDTDDNNKPYRWSGAAWVAAEFDAADWQKIFGTGKPDDNADVTADNTSNDTSNVNSKSASMVQGRAEADFLYGIFRGYQRDNLSVTTSGSVVRYPLNTFCSSTSFWIIKTTSGIGYDILSGIDAYDFSNDFEFFAHLAIADQVADVGANVGSSAFFGFINNGSDPIPATTLGNGTACVLNHIGFYVGRDNVLYGSCANGSTQTISAITGITHTNENNYRIEFRSGVSAKFYVNDVLKLTITTNLPSAAIAPDLRFDSRAGAVVAHNNWMVLFNNYKIGVNTL